MLNQVVLIGNLTDDPELSYTSGSGIPLAKFTLAVGRPFTNQQGERDTDFINIVVWRKQAENCANYLKKGSQAAVVGRLQIRSFEDSQGIKRKASEIVAENVRFLDRPPSSGEATQADISASPSGEEEISSDDVPF